MINKNYVDIFHKYSFASKSLSKTRVYKTFEYITHVFTYLCARNQIRQF
jgi:hypothetical protein